MAKQVSPPKLTGGGGFDFEDRVGAYFLAKLLAGRPPFNPADGLLSRIQFQGSADGWALDDIILTLVREGGMYRWAQSVKSNAQFTMKKAPSDFVEACWEQLLRERSAVFDESRDELGICIAPPSPAVSTALSNLRQAAQTKSGSELARHINTPGYCSQEQRDLFKSFACPRALAAKHSIAEDDTGRLLARILVRPFDFQGGQSADLREAHATCLSALESGDDSEALSLWDALRSIAGRYRGTAGSLDLPRLRAELGARFRLKGQPRHDADWRRLESFSEGKLRTVLDSIGGKVALSRTALLDRIDQTLTRAPALSLLGGSGLGKSVAAKAWLKRAPEGARSLWLDAQDLAAWESKLRLDHPAVEVLAMPPEGARLVVDGLDRVYDDQVFKSLSALLQGIGIGSSPCLWKLLLTCQPEEWSRVEDALRRANLPMGEWESISIELPTPEDLAEVWKAFPALRPVCQRQDLASFVCKPKILDMLASQLAEGKTLSAERWLGESDLIAWFWENEVRNPPHGATRSRFTQLLAEKQGELISHEIPNREFGMAELSALEGLVADRICVERDERIAFAHDIYGDWGRQRVLIAAGPDLPALARRAASPLWHRGIRLYGVHLLEKRDVADWRSLLGQAGQGADAALVNARDLLIESLVVAANSGAILEKVWPDLLADEGRLLKLLLRRFLHIGTMPNPSFIAAMREMGGTDTLAATRNRIPYVPYWLPLLRFLSSRFEDAAVHARVEISAVCDVWLRGVSVGTPLRREAATMALAIAEPLVDEREDDMRSFLRDESVKTIYRAALAAAPELPDAVALFARKACRRVDPPPAPSQTEAPSERASILGGFPPLHRRLRNLPPPWPDGPKRPVDRVFQDICLDTDAAALLSFFSPLVAREVFLALLIDPPEREDGSDRHHFDFAYELKEMHGWYPPIYFNGPFLTLLKFHSEVGLDLILRLTNFAADRLAGDAHARRKELPRLTLTLPSGVREYVGGGRVYAWYRGMGPGPHVVENALMALEFYLYEQVEAERDVTQLVQAILERSNSVAVLGILVALGKKHPELFKTVLMPLLAPAELHQWDMELSIQGHGVWPFSPLLQTAFSMNRMAEWSKMPHRTQNLRDLAIRLFILDEDIRRFLTAARQEWEKRLDSDEDERLQNLAARFDFANYHREETAEGSLWTFTPPKELQELNAPHAVHLQKSQLLHFFPMNCRQILDGKSVLDPSQVEGFWSSIQQIHDMQELPPDADEDGRQNGICGGLAVLVYRHKDWLDSHPDRKAWAARYISQIVRNPPRPSRFDSPVSRKDWSWDRFCAQAVPLLWADEPSSAEWRACAGVLATSSHYETISYLFLSAIQARAALGAELSPLLHLSLRWAAEIASWHHQRRADIGADPQELPPRRQALVESFVRGEISARIPQWSSFASRSTRRRQPRTDRLRSLNSPGFDIHTLEAVLTVWPDLTEASDEAERLAWLDVWRNALQVVLDTLGAYSDQEIDGHPYEWDNWLLGRIGEIIVQMRADERPETLWQPILDLGSPGRMWIDDFLRGLFQAGKQVDSKDSPFFQRWSSMLQYADASPVWRRSDRYSRHYLEENWLHLLGLSGHPGLFWNVEHREIALEMLPRWRQWAQKHLNGGSETRAFSHFLQRPGAAVIVPEGLAWIQEGMASAGPGYWNEHEIVPSLAQMLDTLWHSCQAAIKADARAMQAFTAILNALVARGDAVALQLRDSMGAAA